MLITHGSEPFRYIRPAPIRRDSGYEDRPCGDVPAEPFDVRRSSHLAPSAGWMGRGDGDLTSLRDPPDRIAAVRWRRPRHFRGTVVADLRSRDPHRAYADLHAIARPPREPVLVTDRTKVGLMFRRLVAEWLVNSILGLPPIPEMEPGALALSDILRLDPWAAL